MMDYFNLREHVAEELQDLLFIGKAGWCWSDSLHRCILLSSVRGKICSETLTLSPSQSLWLQKTKSKTTYVFSHHEKKSPN